MFCSVVVFPSVMHVRAALWLCRSVLPTGSTPAALLCMFVLHYSVGVYGSVMQVHAGLGGRQVMIGDAGAC